MDSELVSANARDTNGAEINGAALAAASVKPVCFKNRRLVTDDILLIFISASPILALKCTGSLGMIATPLALSPSFVDACSVDIFPCVVGHHRCRDQRHDCTYRYIDRNR